ncbi:MAG: DUF4956 domain-containing protein [Eubacteriales bacterium]|nr:DUF4956 domain-containing protein [Eubacteriales bacterium]
MESALTFQDILKKSFLEGGALFQTINLETLLRMGGYILVSVALGLAIFWLYRKTYAGVVYSRGFAISLLGMTVITCTIIVTIQSNVVLSLGMVGALSIVRYRTAVKDPLDLLYLFWAVASGIAVGAGLFPIALFAFVVMALLLILLQNRRGRKDSMYILLVHYTGEGAEEIVRRAIGTNPYKIKSKTMRMVDTEMAIEIRMKSNNLQFVNELREVDGITDVTLVQYSGDYVD